ncbi:MAG TPA: hypothetical protein VE176_01625, partial [Candidatus Limnocylindrales bacterium]|nr:hypothetical protein [Candidatus Limnocylindrales bacterium]
MRSNSVAGMLTAGGICGYVPVIWLISRWFQSVNMQQDIKRWYIMPNDASVSDVFDEDSRFICRALPTDAETMVSDHNDTLQSQSIRTWLWRADGTPAAELVLCPPG